MSITYEQLETISGIVNTWDMHQIIRDLDVDHLAAICKDCDEFFSADLAMYVSDEAVCVSCSGNYGQCYRCDEWSHDDDLAYISDLDQHYCESCRGSWCFYCESCGEYVSDEHSHDSDCDCEPPVTDFTFIDDVKADEPFYVSLPEGIIDESGISQIESHLWHTRHFGAVPFMREVGREWKNAKGTYPKRLNRAYYNATKASLPDDVMERIGTIARSNSKGYDLTLEVTRNLNLHPDDFAHGGSCWWGEYNSSRCALKTNGGFGLRSFGDPGYGYGHGVTGRAWVMPMTLTDGWLKPTFDTEHPDALLVFNGYDDLSEGTAARVVAMAYGMTYRKVGLHLDPMYINGESGYLIAPEGDLDDHANRVVIDLDDHANLYYTEQAAAERTSAA